MCGYRENKKCPPWELRADKMTHDDINKTIYYDNTVLKIYNVPIFYFPKIFHPDPTVERRSGFLPPTLNDSKNLGTSLKFLIIGLYQKIETLLLRQKYLLQKIQFFLRI